MVSDPFLDIGQVDTLWTFAWRCINCGEVVDAVIRNHRLLRSHLAVAHQKTHRATIPPLQRTRRYGPATRGFKELSGTLQVRHFIDSPEED
jgi:hypothetical protein